MLRKYNPSSLQGGFDRDKYFEGWFQKVYSAEHKLSFIIIYGYATRHSHDTFGFIQVHIPHQEPVLMHFPKDEVFCDPAQHLVRMGKHTLSAKEIAINTEEMGINLSMMDNEPIRTFKNSMGYSYVIPNLPCYHSVLNKAHAVSGEIRNIQKSYSFVNEIGYLEKNWGTSFPEKYLWLHAVDPKDPEVSLLFSQAEIVWLGRKFTRHVGHLHYDGKVLDLRKLKKCVVSISNISSHNQLIRISSTSIQLELLIALDQKILFKGPQDGVLSRDILHHTDARMDVSLTHGSHTRLFSLVGNYENIDAKFG
jgi:tocopherol cyclase